MSLLMIHEAYMPVYLHGIQIFIADGRVGRRAGQPEVVQEVLADLKTYFHWYLLKLARIVAVRIFSYYEYFPLG